MMQAEQSIPIPWVVSGLGAALAVGMAWGSLTIRVRAVEATVKGLARQLERLADELGKLRELLAERKP